MTKNEFINNVTEWCELIDFCNDENCDVCKDILAENDRDEYIDDWLQEIAGDCASWQEMRNRLYDIPTGYEYYIQNGWYTDWCGLDDDDFDRYKEEVFEWMDGGWEDEGDDEYENSFNDEDSEDLTPIKDEDIPITDLFSTCNSGLKSIIDSKLQEKQAEENNFKEFVSEVFA